METHKEEFYLPEQSMSFQKALESLHNLQDCAFHTFMFRYVQSLSMKQLTNLKTYVTVREGKENPRPGAQ
jgi:hypothetical protein